MALIGEMQYLTIGGNTYSLPSSGGGDIIKELTLTISGTTYTINKTYQELQDEYLNSFVILNVVQGSYEYKAKGICIYDELNDEFIVAQYENHISDDNIGGLFLNYGVAINYDNQQRKLFQYKFVPLETTVTDVQVNGTSVINNNVAEITLPTNVSDLTNDSGFITGMTILSYGTSTWNDFITAYQANKIVYCRASSNSNPATGAQNRLAFMAYVNNATTPTEVEFQYYRSVSSHTVSQQGDQVYVYKLNNQGTWSVTVREASVKVVAGTGLDGTYSNGTMTLTGPTKVSDLTNDSGFITLADLPIYNGGVS